MILITGGSGLLGQELKKTVEGYYPSHDFLDITNKESVTSLVRDNFYMFQGHTGSNLIVHCAAFTSLERAEKEKQLAYDTNVIGTRNIASLGIPMIYISTEYVFEGDKGNYEEEDYPNPQNFYAYTKLLGEYESRKAPRSVVIRCLFKARPFKHDVVCADQVTSGDYVDRIAPEIASAIKNFAILPETLHIGTGRKTLEAIARETKPGIELCSVEDIKSVRLPRDTSLNCAKWEAIKRDNRFCKD